MTKNSVFEKLTTAINQPRTIGSTGYEPVFYAVYPPEKTYAMQGVVKAFFRYLQENGHQSVVFNVSEVVWDILENSDDWPDICRAVNENPELVSDLQPTINEIVDGKASALIQRLRETIQQAAKSPENNPVVLVTGMEILHGITRPGTIETRLNGSFVVPTIFFYPGRMEGGAGLSFLGFYPVDSNYRSEHFDFSEALS